MIQLRGFCVVAVLLSLVGCGSPSTRSSSQEASFLPKKEGFSSRERVKAVSPESAPMPAFDWPVDEARMTRGFFLKDPKGHSRRPHFGIDLAAPRKTPIYASHNGTVIYVGREFRGFGRMIMIEGKGGWATLYAHLAKARVKEGQVVRQGDLIGDMGRTGHATGVHLHFEIRKQSGPVDPLLYLPQSHMARAQTANTSAAAN